MHIGLLKYVSHFGNSRYAAHPETSHALVSSKLTLIFSRIRYQYLVQMYGGNISPIGNRLIRVRSLSVELGLTVYLFCIQHISL